MRAAPLLGALLLAGCSLVFDGGRHVSGGEGEGDAGRMDAGPSDAGARPACDPMSECCDWMDCVEAPTGPFCVYDPGGDDFACEHDCRVDADCEGFPAGTACVDDTIGGGRFCSCRVDADCPDPASPICEPDFGCQQCRGPSDCLPGEGCGGGLCWPRCDDGGGCPPGLVCSPGGELCEPPSGGCLPVCGSEAREACESERWRNVFPFAAEADRAFPAFVAPAADGVVATGHQLAVVVGALTGGDADAGVVHHSSGARREALVTGVRFDGSIAQLTAPAAVSAGFTSVASYHPGFEGGQPFGAVWGVRDGSATAELYGPGLLRSQGEPGVPPWPARAFWYEGRPHMTYRVRGAAAADHEIVMMDASGATRAALGDRSGDEVWIDAAEGVVIGNDAGSTWLWDGSAVAPVTISGTMGGYRGALTHLFGEGYFAVVPALAGPRLVHFPDDCVSRGSAACEGMGRIVSLPSPEPKLPAFAAIGDFAVLASSNPVPGGAGGDEVVIRSVRPPDDVSPVIPVITPADVGMDRPVVEDVAIGARILPDRSIEIVVAAVFRAADRAEVWMVAIRACQAE
ncbi:MAG: hypothetical protein VYE22_37510 [Myxococcota bacterium]|nr:hypothetical protein [Myxococcota bacterium]